MRDPEVDSFTADLEATLGRVGESEVTREASAKLNVMLDAARPVARQHVDPTTLQVRFTRLKAFSLSAAHYHLACQNEVKNTIAIRMGSGFHAAMFMNRPVVCYDGRRAGKAWERFEARHREQGAVILNQKEYAITAGMINAVQDHPRAMELLFDGTTTEHTIEWSIGSRGCRSTPDACTKARDVDLKSARSTEPRWLARECLRRHYHAQLAFYDQALETVNGVMPSENYLVCVENVAPYNVVVLRLPDATREAGVKLCRLWWEQLLLAEATGRYGGYVESDIDLEMPDWDAVPTTTVEIDGELVHVT